MDTKITLAAARVNAKLNRTEAAAKLGINRATLRNYEMGISIPTWDIVLAIEQLYGWPANRIMFGKELIKED